MNKFCLLFLLGVTGVVLLGSCKKYYESVPVEAVTSDYIWDTKDSNGVYASEFLFSIYASLPDGQNRISRDFLDAGSDDAVTSQTSAAPITLLATNGITIFNNPDDLWTNSYASIRKATDFLNNFSKVPLKNTYERRSWFGEARVMRAFFYFELVKRYGGVPIVGDSVKTLKDDVQIPRSSFERCINYIVSECNQAIDSLRDDPVSAGNYGRWTKDGARALKAHVLLYAASPLYNGGNVGDSLNGYASYDANRWKLAADAAKAIMDEGRYQLETDFKNIFLAQQSVEVIFAKTNTQNYFLESRNGPINFSTAPATGNTSPTQELVDAYGMSNGLPISDPASGYNPQDPYSNRDPRLTYTVLYNGAQWLGTQLQTFNGGVNRPGGTTTQTQTGYYMRKFLGNFENATTYENHYTDWVYYRYGEVLLNYAEAMNEFAGPTEDVFNAVEAIRQRAGLNPYALDHSISQDSLRTIIRNERHKEMAFEEQRYWDIRRWKIAGEIYNSAPLHGISITKTPTGFLYNIVPVLTTAFDESKMYFYPIPYSEVVSNINMRQNPGWD
ncbi:RagB/SusD family nutrient uptake outer membrane protein [Ilyomonas limi]|uniref:RagB/SusD family nutrient uptake outer membrane protein n=1 Tax=Ilyomonas limi TaxID=2575867 RepID=A0A4V6XAV0_9BACT|nr:RagB/SusD family nutrient uptake outer membrane protein [Ilyomonas limi]TKK67953.1 RagB/SusD family nutrient uptake outer membrane protein [Ilyomonas limi]